MTDVAKVEEPAEVLEVEGPTLLAPLALRYAPGRFFSAPPEPDGVARAMPVVLRLERPPAARTPILEAAAAAALAVCLDPPPEWVEPLETWIASRIRKIARRARGAHWDAVQELPGVTITVGDAQVRALVPGPVATVAKALARLQIGGTELEADTPGPPPPGVPVIYVNAALHMSVGKAAAQVGHAAMLDAATRGVEPLAVPRFAVRDAGPDAWAKLCAAVEAGEAVAVRDGGFTEVAPGTLTAIVTPPG